MNKAFLPICMLALAAGAQESPRAIQPRSAPSPAVAASPAQRQSETNYRITVTFMEAEKSALELRIVTAPGQFKLQGRAPKEEEIDENLVPVTLDLDGTLEELPSGKSRLTLFLGRTRPYATGATAGPGGRTRSQIQMLQEGFNSTVILMPDKPLPICSQGDQEVVITLHKLDD